jgi:hypothetical protein
MAAPSWLMAIGRIANGVMNVINRIKKKNYADDPAAAISNGKRVQHSSKNSPTWPTNLNVTKMSDGGVCLDEESAVRLAEFRADIEAM